MGTGSPMTQLLRALRGGAVERARSPAHRRRVLGAQRAQQFQIVRPSRVMIVETDRPGGKKFESIFFLNRGKRVWRGRFWRWAWTKAGGLGGPHVLMRIPFVFLGVSKCRHITFSPRACRPVATREPTGRGPHIALWLFSKSERGRRRGVVPQRWPWSSLLDTRDHPHALAR